VRAIRFIPFSAEWNKTCLRSCSLLNSPVDMWEGLQGVLASIAAFGTSPRSQFNREG